jgi:hypothetical protein
MPYLGLTHTSHHASMDSLEKNPDQLFTSANIQPIVLTYKTNRMIANKMPNQPYGEVSENFLKTLDKFYAQMTDAKHRWKRHFIWKFENIMLNEIDRINAEAKQSNKTKSNEIEDNYMETMSNMMKNPDDFEDTQTRLTEDSGTTGQLTQSITDAICQQHSIG